MNNCDKDQLYLSLLADIESDEDDDEAWQQRQLGVFGALMFRSERQHAHRTYLVRGDLLPNPHVSTPWQALYSAQKDHAFITTMGVDTLTF
ncbi:hypothetical protein EDD22DRAFT_928568, partial [Suillus occidentalis]